MCMQSLAEEIRVRARSIVKQANKMQKKEGSSQKRECNTLERFQREVLEKMRLITDQSKKFGVSFWMPESSFDEKARQLGPLPDQDAPEHLMTP